MLSETPIASAITGWVVPLSPGWGLFLYMKQAAPVMEPYDQSAGAQKWRGRRGSPTPQRSSGLRVAAPTCRTSNGLREQFFGTQQQDGALRSRIQKERTLMGRNRHVPRYGSR